ncbi:MAG: insulinase family protein [Verrucomicrobiota bacterium]|nr:insulinase family protein [Verrucomicrobiota bacterium]
MPQLPEITLRPGEKLLGFEVKAVTPLEELRAVAYLVEHAASGARLLHLHADDAENLFSVSFPTPPQDDTGLPHILEHCALGGSRKFPVREPFFEMLKMSMATFLNAMTGLDCTYYPAASNVKKDLFNLAEVYFDAVFHPLITEDIFLREGHRLAPAASAKPTGRLTIKGIVYNEMKGAFSDPEGRIWRGIMRGVFPDTVYGRESGGNPNAIPDLTYEDFLRFHRAYYHPGNAYFCLYGDIPTSEHLAFLADKLAEFSRTDVQPLIERQRRWRKPRTQADTYSVGRDEGLGEKTCVALHWLVGNAVNPREDFLFQALTQILFGNEAAPLRKAIIDSKIGHDLIPSGSFSAGCELTFMVGVKGSEKERQEDFVKLVMDTLARIAEGAIERGLVEAAFQQVAYRCLEIQSMFPLHTMNHVMEAWIYGADPLTFLRMRAEFDACRALYEKDAAVFNRLIRERLLANPHRLTFALAPDRGRQKRTDRAMARKMRKIRNGLSEDALRAIAERDAEIERKNSEPNPPDALARLPQLKIGDLPAKPRHIPTTVETLPGNVELLVNDVFANGVNYLELSFDLDGLPSTLWPYLRQYCDAVHKLGAAGMNYEQIARRVAASTGGLGCKPVLMGRADDPLPLLARLHFSLKTLDGQIEPALDVLENLLLAVDPRDPARLKNVVTQARAAYRSDLVQDGARTALLRAGRALSLRGHLAELLDGLPQLREIEEVYRDFDRRGAELMDWIEAIRDFLPAGRGFTASFTGSESALCSVRRRLAVWAGRMNSATVKSLPPWSPPVAPSREGLAGAIQVAHCARVMPAPHFSHPDEPLLALGAHLVNHDYMLSEIRLKGAAYGAGFRYDGFGETIAMWSYNDPHITRTLHVYEKVLDHVRAAAWSQTDVNRAIIATAKQDERPIRPGAATGAALMRRLAGLTPALREQRYARLKEATPAEVKRALVAALEANLARSAVCVTASREKLEAANREMKDKPLTIEDILRD